MTAPTTELERLRALEWSGAGMFYGDLEDWCPVCETLKPIGVEREPVNHAPDCWLAARIAELEDPPPQRVHSIEWGLMTPLERWMALYGAGVTGEPTGLFNSPGLECWLPSGFSLGTGPLLQIPERPPGDIELDESGTAEMRRRFVTQFVIDAARLVRDGFEATVDMIDVHKNEWARSARLVDARKLLDTVLANLDIHPPDAWTTIRLPEGGGYLFPPGALGKGEVERLRKALEEESEPA